MPETMVMTQSFMVAVTALLLVSLCLAALCVPMVIGQMRGGAFWGNRVTGDFWTVREIALAVAFFFLLQFILSYVKSLSIWKQWLSEDTELLLFGGVFQVLIMLALLALAHLRAVETSHSFFERPRGSMALIGWGAIGMVAIWPVIFTSNSLNEQLVRALGIQPQMQKAVEILLTTKSPLTILWLMLTAVFFAPVVEEILFRGMLYPFLKKSFGHMIPRKRAILYAAVLTSVLFSGIHDSGVTTLLPLSLLALFFTAGYEKTGSLLTPIAMHAVFNAISCGLVLLMRP